MSEPVANFIMLKESDAEKYLLVKDEYGTERISYDKLFSKEEQDSMFLPSIYENDQNIYTSEDGMTSLYFMTNWNPAEELFRKLAEKTDFEANYELTSSYGVFKAVDGEILDYALDTIFAGDAEFKISAKQNEEGTFTIYSERQDEDEPSIEIGTVIKKDSSYEVDVDISKMFDLGFEENEIPELLEEVSPNYLNNLVIDAVKAEEQEIHFKANTKQPKAKDESERLNEADKTRGWKNEAINLFTNKEETSLKSEICSAIAEWVVADNNHFELFKDNFDYGKGASKENIEDYLYDNFDCSDLLEFLRDEKVDFAVEVPCQVVLENGNSMWFSVDSSLNDNQAFKAILTEIKKDVQSTGGPHMGHAVIIHPDFVKEGEVTANGFKEFSLDRNINKTDYNNER